jgi:hypothetical protein
MYPTTLANLQHPNLVRCSSYHWVRNYPSSPNAPVSPWLPCKKAAINSPENYAFVVKSTSTGYISPSAAFSQVHASTQVALNQLCSSGGRTHLQSGMRWNTADCEEADAKSRKRKGNVPAGLFPHSHAAPSTSTFSVAARSHVQAPAGRAPEV